MSDKTEKSGKIEFRDFFRFTKNGRMKSGTLAYSISLAALYLIVYGAAYYFLIDVLAPMTAGWPMWASDLTGAVVPALAGALVLLLPVKLLYDRRWALYGYLWIAGAALVFLIAMLVLLKEDPEALSIFLRLFLVMVPAPIIIGGTSAWLLYKKQIQTDPMEEEYD